MKNISKPLFTHITGFQRSKIKEAKAQRMVEARCELLGIQFVVPTITASVNAIDPEVEEVNLINNEQDKEEASVEQVIEEQPKKPMPVVYKPPNTLKLHHLWTLVFHLNLA